MAAQLNEELYRDLSTNPIFLMYMVWFGGISLVSIFAAANQTQFATKDGYSQCAKLGILQVVLQKSVQLDLEPSSHLLEQKRSKSDKEIMSLSLLSPAEDGVLEVGCELMREGRRWKNKKDKKSDGKEK
ncbi:glycine--tRNA ligase beta subunit [Striga asiatica]|uniref:Glycine--tRNA ligase beta subunit n=1 Tax=Striga asiatica TaxID=4170 RepID=A0A5A7P5S7_STRAF|nr:glycine--tRNA ligase beta subunit [Striga asiatica]